MRPRRRQDRPADIRAISESFDGDASTISRDADNGRPRRRVLYVELVNANCTLWRGHGSRELLTEVVGRPPVWATISRGWTVTDATARDAIALAESRGYDVVVTGAALAERARWQDPAPSTNQPDSSAGLW